MERRERSGDQARMYADGTPGGGLDQRAERALHLLELPKVLAKLAELTVSEGGYDLALGLRPAGSLDAIRERCAWFAQGRVWLAQTEFALSSFPSLVGVLRLLEAPGALLDLDALWGLKQGLAPAMEAIALLRRDDAPEKAAREWPLLLARASSFLPPAQSMAALKRCVSDDGLLRDESSPELSLARGEIRRLHQGCTRRVKDFVRKEGLEHYLQDDYMTLASDRYVLPLKTNFKGRLQGIIHDYSQTGETCYFEPLFLVEINNRLQELKREEREAEVKVLRYLSELLRGELPGLHGSIALLAELDLLQAVSALAVRYDGHFAEFGEDRNLSVRQARHPLLALAHAEAPQSAPTPVPVDLVLKPGQRGLIVSGGNAGGKTVCLKTLGLCALMGMCGLPIPAALGASFPLWRHIHVFIGDEQSLEDHLSTFTAQVRHLAEIWPGINGESLVILDEFGAGTDPSQGAALAQAVVDGLLERGASVVAATHFPALKAYALSRQEVRAASVLFDPASKKPLFRLAYDQVGASQALDAAREHGLPEEVLLRAEQYLLLDGADASALVERLNGLAVEREKELAALNEERNRLDQARRSLAEKFAKEREALFERIQAEARTILKEWKASRLSHRQAMKELAKTRKILISARDSREEQANGVAGIAGERPDIASLQPGMELYYGPWEKSGQVVDVDRKRDRVRMDMGGITLWTELEDLTLPPAGKEHAPRAGGGASGTEGRKKTAAVTIGGGIAGGGVRVNTVSRAGLRLDLRGMRADVALADLEKFLDAALLGGRNELTVVHGRGTGALRREVHAFLATFPHVASYALAPEDLGGDGVTLVELA